MTVFIQLVCCLLRFRFWLLGLRLRLPSLLLPPLMMLSSSSPYHFAHGKGSGLHCGWDGHVEYFCYRKKNHQAAHRSSHTTSTSTARGSKSSIDAATQEMFMLLRRLATSTPPGVADSVTQSNASTGSAAASQSSTEGPPITPGTCFDT